MQLIPLDDAARALADMQLRALALIQRLNAAGTDFTWAMPWGMEPREIGRAHV